MSWYLISGSRLSRLSPTNEAKHSSKRSKPFGSFLRFAHYFSVIALIEFRLRYIIMVQGHESRSVQVEDLWDNSPAPPVYTPPVDEATSGMSSSGNDQYTNIMSVPQLT